MSGEGPATLPAWAEWAQPHELGPYTLGVEEEVMLLDQHSWALASRIDSVLPRLPNGGENSYTAETHGSAVEIQTGIHARVGDAIEELGSLRRGLDQTLRPLSMRAASAGTHPFAVWQEIVVSAGERYQFVYGSMRELARREPTFGLHVHVGVGDAEAAIYAANRLRTHIPLLLALSVNSPFWQGRDTGLASARTPLFQAFPRVGIPRPFVDYAEYVESVDVLIRCDAVPEPTFLWWDVRPQPRFGTVEVRIMDAQTKLSDTAAIAALVQCIVRSEVEEGNHLERPMPHEVLSENRFLAARDGMEADLIEPELGRRVPARELLADLVAVCGPHARELDCEPEMAGVLALGARTGAQRQIEQARALGSLPRLVGLLAADFLARD
ncbi:MAG: glutamate---cysteine ligase / carboxylate-amine ligase [Solirubrobacterales bacterium]|nr:glutamate---cysteine ligase / carboxylate-amine ligase [Solirubrobacterales bacterium]